MQTFNDFGADSGFIDKQLVTCLGPDLRVGLSNLQAPVQVIALDNHVICPSCSCTEPIKLSIEKHQETLNVHVIRSPQLPLVLGATWLQRHNLHIEWLTGRIVSWAVKRLITCFCAAPTATTGNAP